MSQSVMVGMAEVKVSCGDIEILMALGLGSCIGICAYDSRTHVAGLAHVVLPESGRGSEHSRVVGLPPDQQGKFADTAVPTLLEAMVARGAQRDRIRIAVVGGAQIFSFQGAGTRLAVGNRNAEAVLTALEEYRLPIVARDLGGNTGRTVHLFARDGRVHIKTIGQGARDLVILGEYENALQRKAA